MSDHIPTFAAFERSMNARSRGQRRAEPELACGECGVADGDHERWCHKRHAAAEIGGRRVAKARGLAKADR